MREIAETMWVFGGAGEPDLLPIAPETAESSAWSSFFMEGVLVGLVVLALYYNYTRREYAYVVV